MFLTSAISNWLIRKNVNQLNKELLVEMENDICSRCRRGHISCERCYIDQAIAELHTQLILNNGKLILDI